MKKLNQSGFGLIETLLILVALGLIGFTGWYVWHSQQNANKNFTSSNSSSPTFKKKAKPAVAATPYVGWQTYSGHSFTAKYPANWIYQDLTGNDSNGLANHLSDVTFSNHSIVTGVDASPYPVIGVSVFSDGYIYDSGSPAVSDKTDLVTFIRSMNGLIPSQEFSQVKQETKTIDGKQAIKFVGGNLDTPWTMKIGSNIYQFTMSNGASNPIDNTTLQAYLDNFLASFQLK